MTDVSTQTKKNRARCAAYYSANREKILARQLARNSAYYSANREKILARQAANHAANPAKKRTRFAAYRAANRGKINAKESRREARKLAQLCTCCTAADIRVIYEQCPPGHEVDHKLPLAIGGLHCCKNLQILSEADHAEKTRREDMGNIAALKSVWRTLGVSA